MTTQDIHHDDIRARTIDLPALADAATRITAGLFLVPHGAQKLFGAFGGHGLSGTAQFFGDALGMPMPWLAALATGSVEFFGGLLLAVGLATRVSALAIAVLLAVAATVHIPNGFFWSDGGWEYPVLWLIVAAAFVLKGGGRYSADRAIGWRF